MLTENLKTLRVLHQLLMVVAAAILVFALRLDRSRDYRAALDELRAMQDLNFSGWITFVRDRYKTYGNQNDEFAATLSNWLEYRFKVTHLSKSQFSVMRYVLVLRCNSMLL